MQNTEPELDPLLIDHAAAAEPPTDEAARGWLRSQRVFISSVIEGYGQFREAAASAIETVGANPVWFEKFGGRDGDPNQAYLAEVRSSDIYVGLLGARYGKPLPSRFSATHEEYLDAEGRGLRLSVWVEQGANREGHQQSFLEEVRTFNVTGSYGSPAELQSELEKRLQAIAAEELSPWCKLGPAVFRARQITERSGTVRIEATVKDDQVVEALRAFGDRFGRRPQLLTFQDRCVIAQVDAVEVTSRAARSREVVIEAAVEPVPQPLQYGMNGVQYEELTELALKVTLFGTENPMGILAFQAELPNPLTSLARAHVAEEAVRPLALLLLTELLLGTRAVARILRFRLGSSISGMRALELEWEPASQYSGRRLEARTVSGRVHL